MTIESPPHSDDASELAGPLNLSVLEIPGVGEIGLIHCPGRQHVDAANREWRRELSIDLRAISAWNALGIVTLLEQHEFEKLGVPDLAQQVTVHGLRWFHLPIPDMQAPGEAFNDAWSAHGETILGMLGKGERVVMHCAAGLGRTGMVAAKLLMAFGVSSAHAIDLVRSTRPGSIETDQQARYVISGPILSDGKRYVLRPVV